MNVGDYCRTPKGITKIIDIRDETIRNSANGNEVVLETKKYITDNGLSVSNDYKTSPRIIDLIEENDYVNGNKIIKISQDHCGRTILIYGYDDGERQVAITIYEDEIKTIVTHEQFENVAYRVEE